MGPFSPETAISGKSSQAGLAPSSRGVRASRFFWRTPLWRVNSRMCRGTFRDSLRGVRKGSSPLAEHGGSDPYACRALRDRPLEISTHAH